VLSFSIFEMKIGLLSKLYKWIRKILQCKSVTTVTCRTGIFVAIANNTLYGSKLLIFLLCQKSLGY